MKYLYFVWNLLYTHPSIGITFIILSNISGLIILHGLIELMEMVQEQTTDKGISITTLSMLIDYGGTLYAKKKNYLIPYTQARTTFIGLYK